MDNDGANTNPALPPGRRYGTSMKEPEIEYNEQEMLWPPSIRRVLPSVAKKSS